MLKFPPWIFSRNKRSYIFSSCFLITQIQVLSFVILIIKVNHVIISPNLEKLDKGSLADSLYAILLVCLVIFVAVGLGQKILKPLKLDQLTFIEKTVINVPIGLAVIGYLVLFLGLIGWIEPVHHIALLVILSVFVLKNSIDYFKEGLIFLGDVEMVWQSFSMTKKVTFGAGILALLFALLQTLTPPWDYDGLMYHLQGPRLFLELGGIKFIPENWFTIYPSNWQMLYLLGMGLGSDIFARLIHFITLLLLILATYVIGKRFLPEPGGWVAAGMMVGTPMLLMWGSFAYIDLAWALFQFLAIGLILIWVQKKDFCFLVLSGIMQGLALGSKYFALFGAGIILIIVIYLSLKNEQPNNRLLHVIKIVFGYGAAAFIVALPWYLRNFVWTGNPVFPYFFNQELINPAELNLTMQYLYSFGTGNRWHDYLLLPIRIYTNHLKFATFMGSMDFPNPLFLLVFCYPLFRKKIIAKTRTVLDILVLITTLQFLAWATGSLQTRFLLPLYPGLSIIASSILLSSSQKFKKLRLRKILVTGLIGGVVFSSLILMSRLLLIIQPYSVLLGVETKRDFLSKIVNDFQANDFINNHLPEKSIVLIPWNGRGYYCDHKCYPDIGQAKWTVLIMDIDDIAGINARLKNDGFTHILLSKMDAYFFVYEHDPQGVHRRAYDFLLNEYAPNCTEEIYQDQYTQLFEITSQNIICQQVD